MNYYLDTEFIEDGKTIDLISIGIVDDYNRTFYVESNEFDYNKANSWVKQNVLPYLKGDKISRKQIHDMLLIFINDPNPVFWGYYADYDWVVFCQLFGQMIDLPSHFPMYCRDLKQLLDERRLIVPFKPEQEHHALYDAIWNKRVYEWILTQ